MRASIAVLLAGTLASSAVLSSGTATATLLTFDVSGGISNFQAVPQDYGDRVAASTQGGHSYGLGAEGFTPNVVTTYGAPDEIPALWRMGYGDLANVQFNDQDGDSTLTIAFAGDPGFHVSLLDFDIASFSSGGQTIQGLFVRDVITNAVLFSLDMTFVTGADHLLVTPNATGQQLELVIDLAGLGTFSDNIGIDNVRFGQVEAVSVIEPATLGLLGSGLIGLGLARLTRKREPAMAGRPMPFPG